MSDSNRDNFDVVWDGSKQLNRGYLNVRADLPRSPAKLEDCRRLMDPPPKLTTATRVRLMLGEGQFTSMQLQRILGLEQTIVAQALAHFRREGVLRQEQRTATEHHIRRFLNFYWIEHGRPGSDPPTNEHG